MLKLTKATHLSIVLTFVVLFVGLYIYYNYNTVNRLRVDLDRLALEMGDITNGLRQIRSPVSAPAAEPTVLIPETRPLPELVSDSDAESDVDDATSVDTQDVKAILEEEDETEEETEEEEEIEAELKPVLEPVVDTLPELNDLKYEEKPDINDLKKLKYDEIKDLCRKMNIPAKGTKETLIGKIQQTQTLTI